MCIRDSVEAVRVLVELGADCNAKAADGGTPLHSAADQGRVQAVRALVELGADYNVKAAYGSTPLHLAASDGHVKAVRVLLELGADFNAKDVDGFTPLFWAAQLEQHAVVKYLNTWSPPKQQHTDMDPTAQAVTAALTLLATILIMKRDLLLMPPR
eukprot:6728887-Pyramimonas_sp.AAC.1